MGTNAPKVWMGCGINWTILKTGWTMWIVTANPGSQGLQSQKGHQRGSHWSQVSPLAMTKKTLRKAQMMRFSEMVVMMKTLH